LSKGPVSEFNASAHPSPELLRRLMFAAYSGNEFIRTAFTIPDGVGNGPKAQAAREKKEREDRMLAQMVMASQQRIERFRIEMKEVEDKRLELLARTEEDLRIAREKRQRLRDAAPEIDFPDGTRRKVFRDYDNVRDETGAPVDPGIIKAEQVSNNPHNWEEMVGADRMEMRLQARRDKLHLMGEEMKNAETRFGEGTMSDKEKKEFKEALKKALADEEQAMKQERITEPAARERTFRTGVQPTADFMLTAAPRAPDAPDRPLDDDFRPRGPNVSAPGPK
jgi:hypothetical protein